jgi:thiol-disulfide isomerase/thioredoxin
VSLVTEATGGLQYAEPVSHLVELFYSDHCLSCPEAREVLQQLVAERSDVVIVEHNVDDDLALAHEYHLIATPALVIDRSKVFYGVPRLEKLTARIDASAPMLA